MIKISQTTLTLSKTGNFRQWNRTIIDWDIEYQGYHRTEDGDPIGFIDFHIIVEIVEAFVKARDKKSYKKIEAPGYKLIITQSMTLPDQPWETWQVYDESFPKDKLPQAFDVFQRELLNIQTWIEIAESRANLIPDGKDVFECLHCGWVTNKMADDIMCSGCGKRYWSEKIWQGNR